MSGRHKFTISRVDGEPIGGEYAWFEATDSSDWHHAEDESDYNGSSEPVEYQIEEWVSVGRWTKTLPGSESDDVDEPDEDPAASVRTVSVGADGIVS